MKPVVAKAIEELQSAFQPSPVTVREDGCGGAYVIVENIEIGELFVPATSWMGGHISELYPYADIYPMFIDAGVRHVDGREFHAPITPGHQFESRPAIQVSRRNNQCPNLSQPAVAKFIKILDYLKNYQ